MSSQHARFIKEHQNRETIEHDYGFIVYSFGLDGNCYIGDIWVEPEERQNGRGRQLLDEVIAIAKEKQCFALIGCTELSYNHPELSMLSMLHTGFVPFTVVGNAVFFKREL